MSQPNFAYEKKLWRKGFKFVVGIDEVGRGAWAGPIVVSAVILPKHTQNYARGKNCVDLSSMGINDSKLLKPREREKLAKEIKKQALAWDVTEIGVGVINKIGIGKVTEKAMRRTVKDIIKKLGQLAPKLTTHNSPPSSSFFVLVDYFYIPYLRGLGRENQLGIKDGDQKSISIAAASILAKVHRDRLMRSLSKKYPQYGWGKNKGYGTRLQQKAILRYGLTRFHRKEFVKSWRKNQEER